MAEFLFCGGSSVRGLWDIEAGGFAGRFKSAVEEPEPDGKVLHRVIIHAKQSRTLPMIVDHFPRLAAKFATERRIGVFLVGASDSRIPVGEDEPVVPLDDFRKNLSLLGDLCVANAVVPAYIGFHPIDDTNTQPFGKTNEHFSDERLRQYTEQVRQHAEETSATFIPTWKELGGGTPSFAQFVSHDELHLNTAGHLAMLDIVMPTLLEIAVINNQT